jgi:AcrR family transcriptional regulator
VNEPRRLTERGRRRRQELLDHATRRFADNGYHPTSVTELVDSLGVGKGVFYWYFPAKDDLFAEILRDAQLDLRRCQQRAIGEEPDPIARIQRGVRASMQWSADHGDLLTLVDFAATEERFRPLLRRGRDVAVADVVRHLKDAIVEGHIPDDDPELLAYAILGITGQLGRTFIHERGADPEATSDAAVRCCLGAIGWPG